MSSLNTVLQYLELPECELLASKWELSESSFEPDNIFFLKRDFVLDSCNKLQMCDETSGLLLDSLSMFDNNIPLQRLAWHFHYMIFKSGEDQIEESKKWPFICRKINHLSMYFYPLIMLSGVPLVFSLHEQHNIPLSVTIETLAVFEDALKRKSNMGSYVWWLIYHFKGQIFKLGRLQFHLTKFEHDFHVFRNTEDNRVLMVAEGGLKFRTDGQFDGVNGIHDPEAWVSGYKVENGLICANPVSACGQALLDTVKLPGNQWKEVLKKDDLTLGIHIPNTGKPMDHAECGESFRRASDFFPAYFPEYKYRAFQCVSWLLDNQFEGYLSESSNIVRFQQEYYLFPYAWANDDYMFVFVFGRHCRNIDELPQNTSLEKAIVKHMKAGGRWRGGGGIIFPEDLNWGNKVYRSSEFGVRRYC